VCQKCREHGLECSYLDIKRIRDQKQLGLLSKKVERYEKLLKQLETEAEPTTARLIRKTLSVRNPNTFNVKTNEVGFCTALIRRGG
jgi:hypothetical protein